MGACILLDGILHVYGSGGARQEPLHTFFSGPGETVLKPGDIVTCIQFPLPPKGLVGRYIKLGRNKASDLAIAGVTAVGYLDESLPSGYCFKLALASVAPVPLVVERVEQVLSETPIDEESLAEAAQIAMDACTPIDDVRASARYRKMMARNLSYRAMVEVWEALRQSNS